MLSGQILGRDSLWRMGLQEVQKNKRKAPEVEDHDEENDEEDIEEGSSEKKKKKVASRKGKERAME